MRPGYGKCDLRQARINVVIPGKAIGGHRDAMQLTVPFTDKLGSYSQINCVLVEFGSELSSRSWCPGTGEKTKCASIEITQMFGLKLIR